MNEFYFLPLLVVPSKMPSPKTIPTKIIPPHRERNLYCMCNNRCFQKSFTPWGLRRSRVVMRTVYKIINHNGYFHNRLLTAARETLWSLVALMVRRVLLCLMNNLTRNNKKIKSILYVLFNQLSIEETCQKIFRPLQVKNNLLNLGGQLKSTIANLKRKYIYRETKPYSLKNHSLITLKNLFLALKNKTYLRKIDANRSLICIILIINVTWNFGLILTLCDWSAMISLSP